MRFELTWYRLKACCLATRPKPPCCISIRAARRKAFSVLPCLPAFLNLTAATKGFRGVVLFRFISTAPCVVNGCRFRACATRGFGGLCRRLPAPRIFCDAWAARPIWCRRKGSNLRRPRFQRGALPTELQRRICTTTDRPLHSPSIRVAYASYNPWPSAASTSAASSKYGAGCENRTRLRRLGRPTGRHDQPA